MVININREFLSSSQECIQVNDIVSIIQKGIGKEVEIKSIETSKNGDVNSSYIITTNNPKSKLFLKIENHDIIPQFYSGQIEREVASIGLLKKHGFPCPIVVNFDILRTDIGKKYILTEFVGGQLLSDVWGGLTPMEKSETNMV